MTDSSPCGNYTSFELWPMFLTLNTPGFVKNIIYPLRYLCGRYWDRINEKLQRFEQSRKDVNGGKVHGNYLQNKTFSVRMFCRLYWVFHCLLKFNWGALRLVMWILLWQMRNCSHVFVGFALLHPLTSLQLAGVFLSKQEFTMYTMGKVAFVWKN